jgi:hypothetical protein
VGDFVACLAASEEVAFGAETVRILKLDALIQAKKAAARRKDREHIIALEALKALRDG